MNSLHSIPKEKVLVFSEAQKRAIMAWVGEGMHRLVYRDGQLHTNNSVLNVSAWSSEYHWLTSDPSHPFPNFRTVEHFTPDMVDYE